MSKGKSNQKKRTNSERDRDIAELQAAIHAMKTLRLPSIDRSLASLYLHLELDIQEIVDTQSKAYEELLKKAQEEMRKKQEESLKKVEETVDND